MINYPTSPLCLKIIAVNYSLFFWKLEHSVLQKRYLNDCVKISLVRRHRKSQGLRKRNVTHKYFVIQEKFKRQVCLQFLLYTFVITHRLIRTIASKKNPETFTQPDQRGKHVPHNKTTEEQMTNFKAFIESLPVLPSHYCRSSSTRKYLPAERVIITFIECMSKTKRTWKSQSLRKLNLCNYLSHYTILASTFPKRTNA